MSSNHTATLRSAARTHTDAWIGLSYVLIGLMALLPRALDLGAYLNIDEAMFWLRRSGTFLNAVRAGNFAATAISTHPGVTTMWLGGAGLLLRDALSDSGLVAQTSFASALAIVRLPLALAHTAGVLLGYGLLRRLLPAATAVLAAALWALDPFVVGYSRMLQPVWVFRHLSLGAYAHHELLGRFGGAAVVHVPVTIELNRHLMWNGGIRPYLGLGYGANFVKGYRFPDTPGDVLVSLGLGSCIGLALVDKRAGVAGLAHIVLPACAGAVDPGTMHKFADHAVPALVDGIGLPACAIGWLLTIAPARSGWNDRSPFQVTVWPTLTFRQRGV